MANSVLDEVVAIRGLLDEPLPNAPSFEDVLEAIEAEYQQAVNQSNNTPNAWAKAEVQFTTTAGTRDYQILTNDDDFDKPLVVVTVPSDTLISPEYQLEFTEVEYLSQVWAWLGQNKGQYYFSSHDAQLIAFYHQLTDDGDEVWVSLRPTPAAAQTYKVIYQVGDWWSRVFASQDLGYELPFAPHKHYLRAVAAQTLLYKCRWSMDKTADMAMKSEIALTLQSKIERYRPVYDEWLRTLVVPDIISIESWCDTNVWQ